MGRIGPWLILPLLNTGAAKATAPPRTARVRAQLAGVSVPFIVNQGQLDPAVAYYAPTFSGTIYVTREGRIVHSLARREPDGEISRGWSLTETAIGGRARPRGERSAEARVSYFMVNDFARWRSSIGKLESVSLGEVWPGVSVSLRAHGKNVEKLFTVAPGADPSRIRTSVAGAQSLHVAESGGGGPTPTPTPIAPTPTLSPTPVVVPGDPNCGQFGTMSCPSSSRTAQLTTADCLLFDGSFYDLFQFQGFAGQMVTIQMTSNAFDTYLGLFDPAQALAAQDDDGGGGTNSRIVFTLNATGTWTIIANSFFANQFGPYTLTLNCVGGPTPTPTHTPTSTPTPVLPSDIPTLSFPAMALLAFGLLVTAWMLMRRG